jgi:C4-dicarboxylate-specific signal transduction histidine kinase
MAETIEAMKERMASLGQQIRAIKQGGAGSSNGEGSLEGVQAELKDLKARLAKAEKEAKLEAEKSKVTLKVPKVRIHSVSQARQRLFVPSG